MKLILNWRARKTFLTWAFTLIELLMVIAIIGILAGLFIPLAGIGVRKSKDDLVKTQLTEIEGTIFNYRNSMGFFPPDNPNDPTQPPLLYELTGVRVDPSTLANPFYTNGDFGISRALANTYFGVAGIQNAVVSTNNDDLVKRSFLPNLNSKRYKTIPGSAGVMVLVVPVDGVNGSFNTWRYVSTSPTHNPGSFDLWAEIVVGGKTNIIGNWKR